MPSHEREHCKKTFIELERNSWMNISQGNSLSVEEEEECGGVAKDR